MAGFLKGEYDLLFRLFDRHTEGNQLGLDWTQDNVDASDGFVHFIVLDFGIDVFDGETRWLEIAYRPAGEEGLYQTVDTPRQAIIRTYLSMTGRDGDFVSTLRVGSEGFARHALDVSSPWATIGVNGTGQNLLTRSAGIKLERNGVTKWHIYNYAYDDTLYIDPDANEPENMVKVNTTLNAKNGIFGSVVIGGDPTGVGYALAHGTMGVTPPANNLRLQSPNGIYFHANADEIPQTAVAIDPNGNVGIGTNSPAYKLAVRGTIQAREYRTGDIIFQKDGSKPVWRMYEDEAGLYVESLTTGNHYSVVLKEIDSDSNTKSRMEALADENVALRRRLEKLESIVQQLRQSVRQGD